MKLKTEDGDFVVEKRVQAHDLHIHTVNGVQVAGVVYADIVKVMGDRLKLVPPPDPDVEAARDIICGEGGKVPIRLLDPIAAVYRVENALKSARAEGHAAGVAEATRLCVDRLKDWAGATTDDHEEKVLLAAAKELASMDK